MEKWLEGLEPVVVHQDLRVPYRYSMGAVPSKFFIEIRDHQKIMGIRCPSCDVVFIPPRSTCGRCFSQLHEWVEVGNQGTLETYTQVRYSTPVQPAVAPFYYGIIKPDGADTGLAHMVGDLKGKEPRIGMRVQAVFKEERKGNMLDILYFKPVKEEKKAGDRGQKGRKGEKAKRRKVVKGKEERKGKKISKKKTANVKTTKTVKRAKSVRKRATVPRRKAKREK
ncbi:MAG TPA: Zn-ribbon domain-containing OB-fold protein [Thermodesulfobacteriota bacterium]|nr:Zn-ribbon domain-containing OB-fold protein [Thermodesulfobacteriota bacterium]